jgi:hypothetical protein
MNNFSRQNSCELYAMRIQWTLRDVELLLARAALHYKIVNIGEAFTENERPHGILPFSKARQRIRFAIRLLSLFGRTQPGSTLVAALRSDRCRHRAIGPVGLDVSCNNCRGCVVIGRRGDMWQYRYLRMRPERGGIGKGFDIEHVEYDVGKVICV